MIFGFAVVLLVWVSLNTLALIRPLGQIPLHPAQPVTLDARRHPGPRHPDEPEPGGARDRIRGEHDYEVNLKAEMEIELLQQKLDELRERQWEELMEMQRQQLDLLRTQVSLLQGEGPGKGQ